MSLYTNSNSKAKPISPIDATTLFSSSPVLTKDQEDIKTKIIRTALYFTGKYTTFPFRGFILQGIPGIGKTFLTKIVAYELAKIRPAGMKVNFVFVDAANVMTSGWGKSEQILSNIFDELETIPNHYTIVVFDDFDSFLFGRDTNVNHMDWYASLGSVLLHRLDELDNSRVMFIGTTNREDLLDKALKSRLYTLKMDVPTPEEIDTKLHDYAKQLGLPAKSLAEGGKYPVPIGTIIRYNENKRAKLRSGKKYILYKIDEWGQYSLRQIEAIGGEWKIISNGVPRLQNGELIGGVDRNEIVILGGYLCRTIDYGYGRAIHDKDLDRLRR